VDYEPPIIELDSPPIIDLELYPLWLPPYDDLAPLLLPIMPFADVPLSPMSRYVYSSSTSIKVFELDLWR
jgi:hypothetical protein